MKYVFSELKQFYANARGFSTFNDLAAVGQQAMAEQQINSLRDFIWYFKQWGFSGSKMEFSTIPTDTTGTVAGTAGERVLTGSGTAWTADTQGVPLRGQFILVEANLYRIKDRISNTKVVLDAALLTTPSGASFTIFFVEYPLRWDVGAIRDSIIGIKPLPFQPERITPIDNQAGEPRVMYSAGQTEVEFASGTATFTQNSRTVSAVTSVTPADKHIGMAITLQNLPDIYYIVDFDAGSTQYTLDRAYTGATVSTVTFLLNPRGTPVVGLKNLPDARFLIKLNYTVQPPKLRGDNDLTGLPNDIPMIAGLEVLGSKFKRSDEGGSINEVLFNDEKFRESLRVLNLRGVPLQNRLYSVHDIQNRSRIVEDTNPWNRRGA